MSDATRGMGFRSLAVLGVCLSSCSTNRQPVSEAAYSAAIVWSWQGTVGDMREKLTPSGDGTFICKLHPTGFIATTLSQGMMRPIGRTWNNAGSAVQLSITSAESDR